MRKQDDRNSWEKIVSKKDVLSYFDSIQFSEKTESIFLGTCDLAVPLASPEAILLS